jgi:hypothetical protein
MYTQMNGNNNNNNNNNAVDAEPSHDAHELRTGWTQTATLKHGGLKWPLESNVMCIRMWHYPPLHIRQNDSRVALAHWALLRRARTAVVPKKERVLPNFEDKEAYTRAFQEFERLQRDQYLVKTHEDVATLALGIYHLVLLKCDPVPNTPEHNKCISQVISIGVPSHRSETEEVEKNKTAQK